MICYTIKFSCLCIITKKGYKHSIKVWELHLYVVSHKSLNNHLQGYLLKRKPALTAGLLSPTPSVPQLQCQEADSCPTGDREMYTRRGQVKKSKTVTEEQE